MKNNLLKKTLPLILVLLFTFTGNAQQIETQDYNLRQKEYDFYMHKHQKLKKTGNILLTAGAGLMLGSVIVVATGDGWDSIGRGGIMFVAGGVSTIASIPVFIAAGSKRRKAKTYLEGGLGTMAAINLNNSKYAAMSLKIDF